MMYAIHDGVCEREISGECEEKQTCFPCDLENVSVRNQYGKWIFLDHRNLGCASKPYGDPAGQERQKFLMNFGAYTSLYLCQREALCEEVAT